MFNAAYRLNKNNNALLSWNKYRPIIYTPIPAIKDNMHTTNMILFNDTSWSLLSKLAIILSKADWPPLTQKKETIPNNNIKSSYCSTSLVDHPIFTMTTPVKKVAMNLSTLKICNARVVVSCPWKSKPNLFNFQFIYKINTIRF